MRGKFLGCFLKWLGLSDPAAMPPVDRIPFVSDFNYNQLTSVAERWKLPLTVTVKGSTEMDLSIPAFVPTKVISAPARTVMEECTIVMTSCMLSDTTKHTRELKKISIPFSNVPIEAQMLNFQVTAVPGTVVLTDVTLNYQLANRKKIRNRLLCLLR